jgi:tRNA A37 threonylcarbamoyladenosine synthetase subunit TsaC/SUA5/YrdC
VLDGGETPHKMASTVVDCTGPEPVVTRIGPVPEEEILAVAKGIVT